MTHIDQTLRGNSGFWFSPEDKYPAPSGAHIPMCPDCMDHAKQQIRLNLLAMVSCCVGRK